MGRAFERVCKKSTHRLAGKTKAFWRADGLRYVHWEYQPGMCVRVRVHACVRAGAVVNGACEALAKKNVMQHPNFLNGVRA